MTEACYALKGWESSLYETLIDKNLKSIGARSIWHCLYNVEVANAVWFFLDIFLELAFNNI